jgi:hypothetical protein
MLQATTLMRLPLGVPETLAILCNGKRGVFRVRDQTVLHEHGAEVSASRFEALCGKGGRLRPRWAPVG